MPPDGGLSPRGRGKPCRKNRPPLPPRSIPAWAGETAAIAGATLSGSVYPRVGGGNLEDNPILTIGEGLSPRGRGKLSRRWEAFPGNRSIPAWAGETTFGGILSAARAVYPRVGGGNVPLAFSTSSDNGLSPRGRGKLNGSITPQRPAGSIPAWAGETAVFVALRPPPPGLSPRGRGKRGRPVHPQNLFGSIPAWAGETEKPQDRIFGFAVYPRVGGGNEYEFQFSWDDRGLSPRGRGKRLPSHASRGTPRSIPAWAGETA